MSGRRPWQLSIWRQVRGAPYYSLGVHLDLHTPTLDLHLPFWTIQIGRNGYWGVAAEPLPGGRSFLGGRVFVDNIRERWSGHSDNCDHAR